MVGLHLLLSPVGTVVKPANPMFVHRPNPILEGRSNVLSRIISRRHARSVEEYRCDLRIVYFNEIVGLITCKSVRFGQSAKESSMWRIARLLFSQTRIR